MMLLKYSASGPNASAGKKLNAPIKSTINISKNTNRPFVVESVPTVVAIFFLPARLPAMASIPITGINLANSITIPSEMFINTVFAPNPANADPLFPPHDEYV